MERLRAGRQPARSLIQPQASAAYTARCYVIKAEGESTGKVMLRKPLKSRLAIRSAPAAAPRPDCGVRR
jgi:hypothetical protein